MDEPSLKDSFESMRNVTVAKIEAAQDAERQAVACRRVLVFFDTIKDPERYIQTLEERKAALEQDVKTLEERKVREERSLAGLQAEVSGLRDEHERLKRALDQFREKHFGSNAANG